MTVSESSEGLRNDTECGWGFTVWITVVGHGIRIDVAHTGIIKSKQQI